MRKVTVSVTQDDINRGIPGSCLACPLARAVHRATGNGRIVVGPSKVGVPDNADENGWAWFVPPPDGFADFMRRFDGNTPVGPRTWEMGLPEAAFGATATEGRAAR